MSREPLGDQISAAATTLEAMIGNDPLLNNGSPEAARLGYDLLRLAQAMQRWSLDMPSLQDQHAVRPPPTPQVQPVAERMARMVLVLQSVVGGEVGEIPPAARILLRTLTMQLDECQDQVEALEIRAVPPTARELPAGVLAFPRRALARLPGGDAA